ncbi:VWA domain-containing protein [Pseudomonas matsuisoli]|uniref:VWFA domain-containing protein n=1 Tax=Pseudomonas matsuisoli TaxID=1515666 RepID=A0A917PM47_9PSED|nr:VWA domain-containing protein [Pseudomonas matsuisoli]GGJ84000.1 hypothetical protein GCM10009304_07520 [Pseudomonas matsuisoli]
MTDLWPHLSRPFCLLLLPVCAWLLWRLWHRRRRQGQWHALLPEAFHTLLLVGEDRRASRKPWFVLGAVWLLTALALAGPSWQHHQQPMLKLADPLVIVLDLSTEMLSGDLAPTRLEHAKRKLLDLMNTRKDAQTGIVVYAGSAHTVVPLSNDSATTRNLLNAVEPSIMPEPGHRADLAVGRALELLDQGAHGRGGLLLMTSALNPEERNGIQRLLEDRSTPLNILGFGTAQGAPIAQGDGGFLRDDQGAILLPRLDAGALEAFADSLDAGYHTAQIGDADLDALDLLSASGDVRPEADMRQFDIWQDQGYWLLLPIVLLAAFAGRKGWILVLPLLLSMPQTSFAFDWQDLWLRPDQRGQRLLEAERPAEAAKRFEDRRWQGIALYQAGDYEGAASRFAQGQSAADRYNLGNAMARAGKLEAAIDAYDQALQQAPDLTAAQTNKALIEDLLRQRQAQQPDPSAGNSTDDADGATGSPGNVTPQPNAETPSEYRSDGSEQGEHPGSEEVLPDSDQMQGREQSRTMPPSSADEYDEESRQALEQWLRQIPDDPSELLRRKFWYEQQQRQENAP